MTGQLALDGTWGKLTSDQRWLLYQMGGWEVTNALIDPDYEHIWQGHWGGANHTPLDGAPKWMTSFQVESKFIRCPGFLVGKQKPRVLITKAQLRAYARSLPPQVRDQLAAARDATWAEDRRTDTWCWCGKTVGSTHQCRAAYFPPSFHPDDDDSDAHYAECRRLREVERAAQAVALQLDVPRIMERGTGTRKPHSCVPWTTADMALIQDNLHLSNHDLAAKLGRTADAIKHKRRALSEIAEW